MISSNTRASRSRYSSPANPRSGSLNGTPVDASKGGGGGGAATEATKTFLQRWLEPSIQTKTSFEEDGLMRYGVVENMAPLGTMPKAKKPGNEGGTGIRRIILRPSSAIARAKSAEEKLDETEVEELEIQELDLEQEELDMAPAKEPLPRKSRNASPAQVEVSAASPPRRTQRKISLSTAIKDVDDAEYNPKEEVPRRRQSGRVSIATKKARQSTARRRSSVSSVKPTPPVVPPTPSGPRFDQEDRDWIDKVVETAVDEALKHYRYPTAWALRTLYDEKSGDAVFVSMLEDVFNQTASAETLKEFSRQLEKKKREGKKDNQGCYYFMPPTTNGRFTPHKPKPAPYGKLIISSAHVNGSSSISSKINGADEETRAAKKIKMTHGDATPRKGATVSETPSSSRRRRAAGSGRGGAGGAGSAGVSAIVSGSARTPSRRRPRRTSASSESSLSSAMSLPSPEESPASVTQSPSTRRRKSGGRGAAGTDASANANANADTNGSVVGAVAVAGADSGSGSGGATVQGAVVAQTQTLSAAAQAQQEPKTKTKTKTRAKSHSSHSSQTQTQTQTQQPPPFSDGPRPGPITTRGKAKQAMPSTSGSNSPTIPGHTHSHTPALTSNTITNSSSSPPASSLSSKLAEASMPGRLAAPELFASLPTSKLAKHTKDTAVNTHMPDDDDAHAAWERRRDAQKVTNGFVALDSSVRGRGDVDDADGKGRDRDVTPVRKTRKTRPSAVASIAARATRSASKRPADDADGDSVASPVVLSPSQPDGSSAIGSRAVTPTNMRPAKRQRTGLRVKSSPVKRKGGTAAGVPRSVGEGNSSMNLGAPKDQAADNDEYCSACGNNGDVVCCDGCPRSFHFECVDMVQSENLPDEWYCNECVVRRFPSRVPIHKGPFGGALNHMEKTNWRAFSLPKKVQNRFEGVKAGSDGDYEDVATNKVAKKKNGYDELPDFYKQREDGQAVLCHDCQKPATEVRAIIPCSICPLHWHIDCLDPPLAVPPVLKTWRCPAHVDEVLIEAPRLAPAHRFRKLKGSQPITPVISRGLKNNGHIEIDWSDAHEDTNESGWPDAPSFGRTYKLSSKGVVLDFIEQLRHQGAGYGSRHNESKLVPHSDPAMLARCSHPIRGSGLERSVDELQLSLNLISLQRAPSEGVDQLRSALLAYADQDVLTLMAKANADNLSSGNLTDQDRLGLRAMLTQMDAMSSRIRFLLGDEAKPPNSPDMIVQGTTPVSEPPGDSEVLDKSGAMAIAPVTEPTPPSTIDQVDVDTAEVSMDLD